MIMPLAIAAFNARWLCLLSTLVILALGSTPTFGQDDGAVPSMPDSVLPVANGTAPEADDSATAPDESASFQTFYDSLGSQGTWIQSSDYGYVWQPQVSDPDWAPYTAGHWVYTDQGWTWDSDEAWGWATYHYGRWVNIDGTGWVWVPGYTWAPAWVSWRYGDGYCGWAPLPPDSFVGIDYGDDGYDIDAGFHIGGDCDAFYGIGAGWYTFLPVTCLGYRHYHDYYCHRGDNFVLINRTTNVTNINVARAGAFGGMRGFSRVSAGGPAFAQVNAVSITPMQKVSLVRANKIGAAGTLTPNSLSIFAPHVNPGTAEQPRHVMGSVGQLKINRGLDVTHPPRVNASAIASTATESQVQQARFAQGNAPAGAKVLTESTAVKPLLQVPLASMRPMVRPVNSTPVFNTSSPSVFNGQRSAVNPSGGISSQAGNALGRVYPGGISAAGSGSGTHAYARPSSSVQSTSGVSRPTPSLGGTFSGGGGGHSYSGGGVHSSGSSQSH